MIEHFRKKVEGIEMQISGIKRKLDGFLNSLHFTGEEIKTILEYVTEKRKKRTKSKQEGE